MKKAYLSLALLCLIPALGLSYIVEASAKKDNSLSLAMPTPMQLATPYAKF